MDKTLFSILVEKAGQALIPQLLGRPFILIAINPESGEVQHASNLPPATQVEVLSIGLEKTKEHVK